MTLLVDTSVWIEHLRRGHDGLRRRLEEGDVQCHPFVIGEVACGRLQRRDEILGLLAALPQTPQAGHDEVLDLVDRERLAGRGLGWIDMHLLASARLAGCRLWTLDRRLAAAAKALGVGI